MHNIDIIFHYFPYTVSSLMFVLPGQRIPKPGLSSVFLTAIVAPERDGRTQNRVDHPYPVDVGRGRQPRSVHAHFSPLAISIAQQHGDGEDEYHVGAVIGDTNYNFFFFFFPSLIYYYKKYGRVRM